MPSERILLSTKLKSLVGLYESYGQPCIREGRLSAPLSFTLAIMMNEQFRQHVESLHPSFEALLKSVPFQFASLPKTLPKAGVYLFSDGEHHLYVGRTNSIRKRLQQHCRPGSSHNSAPFAFRLAREARKVPQATYKTPGSRAHLLQDPDFALAFTNAKTKLCALNIRTVEESNPLRQALLEMYVAVALATPYNDFDNH